MVTELQFYNAVKSYNYRINLIGNLSELEQKMVSYMNERKLTKTALPGFDIEISMGGVSVKEKPVTVLDQLTFPFITADNSECIHQK